MKNLQNHEEKSVGALWLGWEKSEVMEVKVPRVKLGSQGLHVSKQGLGCMGMSFVYGPPKPETDMIKLIHHAVNSGVTFLDTSDNYGPYTNEILIGKVRIFFSIFQVFYRIVVLLFLIFIDVLVLS